MRTIQISPGVKRSNRTKLNRTGAPIALAALLAVGMAAAVTAAPAVAQEKKPNILFIMGDDIGWMQVVWDSAKRPTLTALPMRAPSS